LYIRASNYTLMNKPVLSFLALLLLSVSASAQNFYLRLGAGYDFPFAGSMDPDGDHYSGSVDYLRNNGSVYESDYSGLKKASFATGLHTDIGAAYMFNKNFGVELDLNIGMLPKKYVFNEYNFLYDSVESDLTINRQMKPTALLIPSLVVQSNGADVKFYGRLGFALPLSAKLQEDDIVVNEPGTGAITPIDFTSITKTSFSLGFSCAAGIKADMNNVSLFIEMDVLSMSLLAKEMDLTNVSVNGSSSYNGMPYLSQVPSSQWSTYYSKSPSITSNGNQDATYSIPFSSIGIHAGIMYKIKQKTTSHFKHKNQ